MMRERVVKALIVATLLVPNMLAMISSSSTVRIGDVEMGFRLKIENKTTEGIWFLNYTKSQEQVIIKIGLEQQLLATIACGLSACSLHHLTLTQKGDEKDSFLVARSSNSTIRTDSNYCLNGKVIDTVAQNFDFPSHIKKLETQIYLGAHALSKDKNNKYSLNPQEINLKLIWNAK